MEHLKKLAHSPKTRSLILIWGLTGLSCLFIFRRFLFGNWLVVFSDAGSDTKQQYLMQYSTIVNHLRDGNLSLWDFNNGFGTSMFALNMSNIFLMLVYLAGYLFGVGRIPGTIVYLLILEIFLAGTLCYLFLGCFSFSEKSKVIASYLYGLNGYLLVWGQHYQFGSFVVFLPFLLLLLERAIRRRRFGLGIPPLVAVMVCASVYMSYMSLLLAGCYLIFRMVLLDGSFKKRIGEFFLHCASMVLGIGIGAFIFLPMAHYLLTISSRLDSNESFLSRLVQYCSFFSGEFLETALLRFFSTAFQGIRSYKGYSNFYEAPVFFFSALFVILALQYLFTIHRQEASKKAKLMQYLAVLFFVFCMFVKLGASIFNAFAYPFSRHSFLFMPLFALLVAYTLDQIWTRRQISIPGLLLAGAAIAYAHYTAYHTVTEHILRVSVVLMCLAACFLVVLLAADTRFKSPLLKKLTPWLLLLTCAADVSLEGYLCYNDRDVLTTADPAYWGGLHNPNVTEALNYLSETDPSFYRVEKDYYSGSFCMDGLAQNYRGISTYNSTPNHNLEDFINLVIPNFPIMAKYEYSYRQIGYYTGHGTLFGIKYLLSLNPELELDGFTLLRQFGDVYLYYNDSVSSIARFYTSAGDSAVLKDAYGTADLESMLLETLLLDSDETGSTDALVTELTGQGMQTAGELLEKYALETIPVTIEDVTGDGSSDSVTIPIDQNARTDYEHVYLEFDIEVPQVTDLTVNQDDPLEYHFRVQGKQTKHVQLAIPASFESVTLTRYGGMFQGTVSNIRLLGSRATVPEENAAEITLNDGNNDSLLCGSISAKSGGFLFLPIPYEEGWTASVDGTPTEILRTDVGFMSVPVDAGEHTFTFTYRQPYLYPGILVSVISLSVWGILLLVRVRKKSRAR